MKVLAEIAAESCADLRAGTLRRRDLEAFDVLLEELRGARSVLVTGTGEGKRAAAVGLAAAAAAAGKRTVLIECDPSEPALASALGLAAAPGLYEYLRREADPTGILQALVLAGPGSGRATEPLVCIVAGSPSADGRGLLASEGFAQAIGRLHDAYELVVLEGPPLGGDEVALREVAAQADAALACLDRSAARGWSSRRLRRDLRRLPTRFAGLVARG